VKDYRAARLKRAPNALRIGPAAAPAVLAILLAPVILDRRRVRGAAIVGSDVPALLRVVMAGNNGVPVAELANWYGLSESRTQARIQALTRLGLVRATHGRRLITPVGTAALRAFIQERLLPRVAWADLDPELEEQIWRVLLRLNE
jgi:hypothetical protein